MKLGWKFMLATCVAALPLLGGALMLSVSDASANPEAVKNHAALVTQTSACHSPEKTTLSATAEGIVNGQRRSIPLKVIPLSKPGTFAVTREWPTGGTWAIEIVAHNPDYKGYATGIVVPVRDDAPQLAVAKQYFHAPTNSELLAALN